MHTGRDWLRVLTRAAARVGRWTSTVDDLQTPYVRPQENGHRIDTRWAELVDADGNGLRIEAASTLFGLTVRRWTTQALEQAAHDSELRPSDTTYVTLDIRNPRHRPVRHRLRRLRPKPPRPLPAPHTAEASLSVLFRRL